MSKGGSRFGGMIPFLVLGIIIAVAFQLGRSGGDNESQADWTRDKRENAVHFIEALNSVMAATEISNRSGAGVVSEEKMSEIIALWDEALRHADLVRDEVLDLIHPELTFRFRNQFEPGVRLRLQNAQSPEGDFSAEVEGGRLISSWGDWFTQVRRNLRIPRP